jgi:hypothetical protein
MPEAEVALRLAEYLSELPGFEGHVDVAIDGASIKVHGAEVFDIRTYLDASGWRMSQQNGKSRNEWAATYQRRDATMRIHSRSGIGDAEAVISGRRIIAECKKGPLIKKSGSPEYPLLTAALGQALLFRAGEDDILVAAVPDSPTFRRIAADWRERPRFKSSAIQIALVSRSGEVSGLSLP